MPVDPDVLAISETGVATLGGVRVPFHSFVEDDYVDASGAVRHGPTGMVNLPEGAVTVGEGSEFVVAGQRYQVLGVALSERAGTMRFKAVPPS